MKSSYWWSVVLTAGFILVLLYLFAFFLALALQP